MNLLGSQAFISPECVWYFPRSTCSGSHYKTQPKVCTVLSVRSTYSAEVQPAQVRGSWTFHNVLAIWGSIPKQPCNFQIAGAAERREKTPGVVAISQGCVIIPETWALVPICHPFVSNKRGNLTSEHHTVPLHALLVMSEEPWTQGSPKAGKINTANAYEKLQGEMATQES